MSSRKPFLRARWRHLAMLNYVVDPAILGRHVPRGTELDAWQGRTYVSMVGFMFLDTRLYGVLPIPFHRHFEEVNLRFYVRRKADGGWRRGVVFIKEIVPRAAIAAVARVLYGERYVALPMAHEIQAAEDGTWIQAASYSWEFEGRSNSLAVRSAAPPARMVEGSEAQFIAEHYWGYAAQRDGSTLEYNVEHPPWNVASAELADLDCDAAALYGDEFKEALSNPPASAFLAEGSDITVYQATVLRD